MSRRLPDQLKFQDLAKYLKTQIQILKKKEPGKIDQAKIIAINDKIKQLQKTIDKISSSLKQKKIINQAIFNTKINQYQSQYKNFKRQLMTIQQKIANYKLFKQAKSTDQMDSSIQKDGYRFKNKKLMNEIQSKNNDIQRNLITVQKTVNDTKQQLTYQGVKIQQMDVVADDIQSQLSMIQQFQRIISNRALLTKLMLIVLIIFLVFADLAIFIMKIS